MEEVAASGASDMTMFMELFETCDINLAEPEALIGFAGQRVIEQTVREKLPEGFQRSEFLLEHGTVDQIVDRREMRERLYRILAMLTHFSPTVTAAEPSAT